MWVDLFPLDFESCLLITNAIQLCIELKLCANPLDTPEQLVCAIPENFVSKNEEISAEGGICSEFTECYGKHPQVWLTNMRGDGGGGVERPGILNFQTLATYSDHKNILDFRKKVQLTRRWKEVRELDSIEGQRPWIPCHLTAMLCSYLAHGMV